jgi:hypothetical protein
MSLFSANEVGVDEVTHEIREQQIIIEFNYPRRQDRP